MSFLTELFSRCPFGLKSRSADSMQMKPFTLRAYFSAPADRRLWSDELESWTFNVISGDVPQDEIRISFRTDLPGPSMAFLNPSPDSPVMVLISGTERELFRFKATAMEADLGSTLLVEFDLEPPKGDPRVLPYMVKAFKFFIYTAKKTPANVTLN